MNNILVMVITQELYYVISAILAASVMFGIFLMSKVKNAKLGNSISALAVLIGVIVSLIRYDILPIWLVYICLAIGAVIGLLLAVKIKMIQMPQLIALLNGLGGLSSLIVGSYALLGIGRDLAVFSEIAAMFAIIIGGLTFMGSMVAAGKLHRLINQKPVVIKMHQFVLSLLVTLMLVVIILRFSVNLSLTIALILFILLSFMFGTLFSIRIGGADMPIAISLLNSLSGVAAAISGLAIGDVLLVSIGGIVGASGLLLTQIMCKGMNRSLFEILAGKTTTKKTVSNEDKKAKVEQVKKVEINKSFKDIAREAKEVIIVPGYGMAVAQAQHILKQVADDFIKAGVNVRFAIHPVAGRMPGHMNVLLAEADVDYDDLYEMDDLNDEFKKVDLTIVVGANDVLNPAAREAEDTPIYGMPILNVDQCRHIFIFNYDSSPGYSGVENPLYDRTNGVHLFFGNALETLKTFMEDKNETQVEEKVVAHKDFKDIVKTAKEVIIVPGYGMAVAQAQHILKQVADELKTTGANVRFAIHPVAGRMPGHMNVLLAEADVDYDDLYEMDDLNDEFKDADVTIVVGANDVLNPAAREAKDTPIYGMPILNVDQSKHIFIFNYDSNPGYSGVENPLYKRKDNVYLFFGNAFDTLQDFLEEIKK